MSGAGILFAYESETGWEICLARRAIMPGQGMWLGSGGSIKRGEAPLATALRETAEEWCGGQAVIDHFAPFHPAMPDDSPKGMHHTSHGDWSFFTYIIRVAKRFPVEHVALNDEFHSPARWFSIADLRELYNQRTVKDSIFRAAQYFNLL